MDELAGFLRRHPPFDALSEKERERLAAAARVEDVEAGTLILDAFAAPSQEAFLVLAGQVELWNTQETGPADESVGPGGVFGFSALLAGTALGPRAVAVGPVRLARIPATVVAPAFSSAAGVRFLARNLTGTVRVSTSPIYGIVDQLIVSTPLAVGPGRTVTEVAKAMSAQDSRYAVVTLGEGRFGLVTDALLRERVLAAGLPGSTPIETCMLEPAPTVVTGTLAAVALVEMTDRRLDALVVVDRAGELTGIVAAEDFVVSPSSAGLALREQIGRTRTAEELATTAGRAELLTSDLLGRGRSVAEVTTLTSAVIDAVVRRALALVLAEHPELDATGLTWLALGSNGRREPVPSSDIDAAVVLPAGPDAAAVFAPVLAAVSQLLGRCGLALDPHGATPEAPLFARSPQEWREAAQRWRSEPLQNNAMMMTSLLLDARPIFGDPGLPVVNEVFEDLKRHPGTLKLLLAESLSHRARLRSVRDVLARRGGTFDLKTHALRPVVDIARWAALAVGSHELSTPARLAAAAGSVMVPQDQADVLTEVYDVLQRIRLRVQVAQRERGERPSDVLSLRRLSPLDRSLLAQAVREIAAVQRRMATVAQVTPASSW